MEQALGRWVAERTRLVALHDFPELPVRLFLQRHEVHTFDLEILHHTTPSYEACPAVCASARYQQVLEWFKERSEMWCLEIEHHDKFGAHTVFWKSLTL
ncbi:MAG: hypothetical protein ABIN37_13060 [Burkholderiaceae bacterium]